MTWVKRGKTWTRVTTTLVSMSALASVCAQGCQLFVDDYVADRGDPIDTSALCDLENAKRGPFYLPLDVDSNAHLQEIEAYYTRANPDLMERFDEVAQDFADGESSKTATYLMGEAGIGKTFVMRRLLTRFDEQETCEVDLAAALSTASERLPTRPEPDLATIDGDVVLNELPGFVRPESFSLTTFLEEQGCIRDGHIASLILLDGVDEIHARSARVLVREVEKYLLTKTDAFVHLVLLGRPEGFSPWFSDPARGDATARVTKTIRLRPPQYITKGDVAFRLREYLKFALTLDLHERNGTLDDYVDSVITALERYPFLRYSLGNLSVGNVVLQHTGPDRNETGLSLKAKIFDDMMERNVGTHGRPGSGSRFDAGYRAALEQIAARYTNVNSNGEFIVSPNDTVTLVNALGDPLGEVLVTAVLERSGLAYLSSPTSTTKRFQFSPFWLHGYLAERYNQRIAPKYVHRECH
jgi:hypothetical protein